MAHAKQDWRRKEYVSEIKGKGRGRGKKGKNKKGKGKGKDQVGEAGEDTKPPKQNGSQVQPDAKAKAKAEAKAKQDIINTLATTFSQALSQTMGKGKGAGPQQNDAKGKGKSGEKDYSKIKCWTCGGLHLQKLWGKGQCPNDLAEANGMAAQNKQNGVRCTYWIDKHHTPCGGSHTWEDHKATLQKFGPPGKGKGSPGQKGGKAKGKGKGKGEDEARSLTEGQQEGQLCAGGPPRG